MQFNHRGPGALDRDGRACRAEDYGREGEPVEGPAGRVSLAPRQGERRAPARHQALPNVSRVLGMGLLNTWPGGDDLWGVIIRGDDPVLFRSMGLRSARSPHSGRSVSGAFSAFWLPAISSDVLRAGATPQMGGHAAVVSGMRKGEFQ